MAENIRHVYRYNCSDDIAGSAVYQYWRYYSAEKIDPVESHIGQSCNRTKAR